MTILFWIVPYIIAGGLLWFVSNQTAPFGREVPLSKGIAAVICMGLWSAASSYWLNPIIANWTLLVDLVGWTIIVKLVLALSLRRAVLAVIIYFVVILIATILIRMDVKYHHPKNHSFIRSSQFNAALTRNCAV